MENKTVKTPFVLQKHESLGQAGLHYDLRIKYPKKGKLISFALPKAEVPLTVGQRILAVQTPDHTKDWLKFSGTIESGYGRGKISIVQSGELNVIGWSENHITFVVKGQPMNGKYALIKVRTKEDVNGWLLIKAKDEQTK
jgi:bifunctional non-homologous end joining protein LigD